MSVEFNALVIHLLNNGHLHFFNSSLTNSSGNGIYDLPLSGLYTTVFIEAFAQT